MTAPVSQVTDTTKIPMAAPVNQEKDGSQWRITFLIPSQYTLESAPIPNDTRIKLREVPARLMAAITYSGTWGRTRYQEKETQLYAWIAEQGLETVGEPVFARYNPPFTLWFLRRNEILIPVTRP